MLCYIVSCYVKVSVCPGLQYKTSHECAYQKCVLCYTVQCWADDEITRCSAGYCGVVQSCNDHSGLSLQVEQRGHNLQLSAGSDDRGYQKWAKTRWSDIWVSGCTNSWRRHSLYSMHWWTVDDIHPLVLTICCSTSACCSVEDPLWLPQMDVMLLLLLLLLISITIYGALGHVTPLGLAHVHQFGNFYWHICSEQW